MHPSAVLCKFVCSSIAVGMAALVGAGAAAQTMDVDNIVDSRSASESTGPVRLRGSNPALAQPQATELAPQKPQPYVAGEFERYVRARSGDTEVRRLGAELKLEGSAADPSALVPADYVIATGDEVLVTMWGTVDADLRLTVDRQGKISIPRVGAVQVAGLRNADLQSAVEQRVARVFKGFQLSVSLGQLRGIRVLVTGFVANPGTYTVSALSTVVNVLTRAGGPSAAGSFRAVELRRGGQLVTKLDLYSLLLRGDRSGDALVQPSDVVHVMPVGIQVGVVGSVNRPVVAELRQGETVADALAMAGGLSAVAESSRVTVERMKDRLDQRVVELRLPADALSLLAQGDIVRAFNASEPILSTQRQNKRVRVEGEVARPGEYLLPPNSTIEDAISMAGGLSPSAFLYGAQFTRESARTTQQQNYERALRDLETDLARSSASQRLSAGDQATLSQAQFTSSNRLLERLRALQPSGRIVLQLPRDAKQLPMLSLEDGDRLTVPPIPTTIGVFGSVFNAGSYLYRDARTLDEYLRLAGGPTKGADEKSIFVVRANGQVVSSRQSSAASSWFGGQSIGSLPAEPGDTIFVPEEMDKTTFVQSAKDWTQILYQFGIGLAGIKSAIQ
ncbi:SLBB domain-containing protein [Aquabacterium sp. OR-4]|uniref:SLBB domain-containing protein n=1 Tax=Aquabacterium sp. OR-4 TaxID=2978127 RepID=UPI0021B23019|nr:SLBB domain-containing protein [Aquabacterium sp. OR-4]MDT7834503.1 SLBB domain-containing protein [Aquabacterium sp. OR-4]